MALTASSYPACECGGEPPPCRVDKTMKRFRGLWITLAVCVPLGIALGWFSAHARRRFAQQRPRPSPVRFSSVTHDFGKVARGQSLQCQFPYRNVGSENVRLGAVDSSCGCIVDQSDKSWLAPGESGVIRVRLNTEGYQPPKALANRVVVHFEPADTPPTVLTLKAMVSPDLVAEPAKLVCPARTGSVETLLKLTLKRGMLSREAFRAVDLAAPESYCRLENTSQRTDQRDFNLTILHGKAPAHPRPLFVRYEDASGVQRQIRIPVEFQRPPDQVVLTPKQYFQIIHGPLHPRDLPRTTRQEFQLLSGTRQHLRITRIDARDHGNLGWQMARGEKSDRFTVWLNGLPTRQLYSATVEVHYEAGPHGDPGVALLPATVFVQPND